MALIKWSALISEFKGKLNGSVFSNPTYGAQVRNSKSCKGRDSVIWNKRKNNLAIVASTWKSLTVAQRQSFIDQAVNYPYINKFSDVVTPSGYQLYCTLNLNLKSSQFVSITTALPPVSESEFTDFTLQQTIADGLEFVWDVGAPATLNAICYISPQLSPGVYHVPRIQKLMTAFRGNVVNPVSVQDEFEAAYGPIIRGQKVFWSMHIVESTTGQRYGSYSGSLIFV